SDVCSSDYPAWEASDLAGHGPERNHAVELRVDPRAAAAERDRGRVAEVLAGSGEFEQPCLARTRPHYQGLVAQRRPAIQLPAQGEAGYWRAGMGAME